MAETENYKKLTHCRICNSSELAQYLNFGEIPLANGYIVDNNTKDEKYPLEILYCKNCSLSQLSIIVAPEKLYQNYSSRSSISQTFRNHCKLFAKETFDKFSLSQNDLVADIASNDGCLIREFKEKGTSVLGIDPAKNLVAIANKEGLRSTAKFWNTETAQSVKSRYGKAKIITATNVFAHVHDLHDFLEAINIFMKEDGILIIEIPYLVNFINKKEFDTTYHEHLSYFLIKPIIHLLKKHHLELFDVQQFLIQRGSVRLFVKRVTNSAMHKGRQGSVKWLLDLEDDLGLHDFKKYEEFSGDLKYIKRNLNNTLQGLKAKNKRIAAYGASAKGNALLNFCGIGRDVINYIIDETPEKIGKLSPGNHIPIVNHEMLSKVNPNYLVLLAWNFSEELMNKTKNYQNNGGRYIIPVPTVQII